MRVNSSASGPHEYSPASPTQVEGNNKRKDAAERNTASAFARQRQSKHDASKALKGSSERRQNTIVDSSQPSRRKKRGGEHSSVSHAGFTASVGHHSQKPSKSDKDYSCRSPSIQSFGRPNREITRKPSTKQLAQPAAISGEDAARRQKSLTGAASEAPSFARRTSRTSRASRASQKRSISEKEPAPTHRDGRASVASASRHSVATTASRRSRKSEGARDRSGVSKSRRRHRRSKPGGRLAELQGERDHSLASVVSLTGDSRASVASSKRSLKPIGPHEDGRPKGKVLQMPDGTYVGLSDKNLWLRAMHQDYLTRDYRTCTLKAVFGVILLGVAYILMFRQDLLVQLAIYVRDNVYDTESTLGTIYKRTSESTTTAGATRAPSANEVARQRIRNSHRRRPQDNGLR